MGILDTTMDIIYGRDDQMFEVQEVLKNDEHFIIIQDMDGGVYAVSKKHIIAIKYKDKE